VKSVRSWPNKCRSRSENQILLSKTKSSTFAASYRNKECDSCSSKRNWARSIMRATADSAGLRKHALLCCTDFEYGADQISLYIAALHVQILNYTSSKTCPRVHAAARLRERSYTARYRKESASRRGGVHSLDSSLKV
jgi:hypothetical protein